MQRGWADLPQDWIDKMPEAVNLAMQAIQQVLPHLDPQKKEVVSRNLKKMNEAVASGDPAKMEGIIDELESLFPQTRKADDNAADTV